jgi:hypothetical protein
MTDNEYFGFALNETDEFGGELSHAVACSSV